jgi:hypothetical protein
MQVYQETVKITCKKYILICFTLGTLTQIASVTENNDTGRNFAPVIPDDIGSETAVPTTLPMSSGVNEVVATSEKTMETRSAITADVTSVSMFFSATAASPSPQYNGNATRSSGTEFFDLILHYNSMFTRTHTEYTHTLGQDTRKHTTYKPQHTHKHTTYTST